MKKIMALLLLCMLAVCMLAACGNDKDNNESSDIQGTDSVTAGSDNTVTTVSDTDAYSEPSSTQGTQSKADNSGSSRRTDVSIVSKPVSDTATSAVSDKNNEKPSETESETTVSSEISSTASKPKPVELPDDPF